ncbi:Peptidoglycan O-acetyltransferase [Firmicutes bacterium ASF500]|nr:Peptidoglycan O-acetyltransferase [Firmicutes bacterium ASF500]
MVFSSLIFLLFFLTTLYVCYFIVPRRWRWLRNCVLLVFSLFFYRCGGADYLPLLLASILINYLGGLLAASERPALRKLGLWGAVALGLGLLGWFKYAGFAAENLAALGLPVEVPQIVLPIGISFFTFQGLSYVIDVYRGDARCQKNPLYVALYVALFPQLVAGPIVRYTTVEEEIVQRNESLEEFSQGVVRFLFGLGKKMLLANAMGEIADGVFAQSPETMALSLAWVGAAAYTFQIYFDFSAYSDMAIGLGRMFGFHFLENFNYPYISKSIAEFWRRWHISLATWFRDYVYIPLGGSRCSVGRNIRNMAVVWLLTGLWHGAAWTYVTWGGMMLVLLAGEKYCWGRGLSRLPSPVQHLYTILLVVFSMVMFRSSGIGYGLSYFRSMIGLGGRPDGQAVYYLLEYWPEWIACVLASLPVKVWAQRSLERREGPLPALTLEWGPKFAALGLLGLSYTKLATGSFNPFIYFQF